MVKYRLDKTTAKWVCDAREQRNHEWTYAEAMLEVKMCTQLKLLRKENESYENAKNPILSATRVYDCPFVTGLSILR